MTQLDIATAQTKRPPGEGGLEFSLPRRGPGNASTSKKTPPSYRRHRMPGSSGPRLFDGSLATVASDNTPIAHCHPQHHQLQNPNPRNAPWHFPD
jgi:hypothetical protein